MPRLPFDALPDRARVWVFATDRPIVDARAERLLAEVDAFLSLWAAHGTPLMSGCQWLNDRFLTIAVDEEASGASGCSIDTLFRALKRLEPVLGASLTDRALVFYRDREGRLRSVTREDFATLASTGEIDGTTTVVDPTVSTLGEWRSRFEAPAATTWHAELLSASAA